MMVEESKAEPAAIAKQLASAAEGTVLWAKSVTWPASFTEVLPKALPPLRTDRDTVVYGTCKGDGPVDVQVTAAAASGEQKLAWTIKAATSSDDNNYLPAVVDMARADGGLSLPVLDSADLKAAKKLANMGAHNLSELARQALATGHAADAVRLADAALQQDAKDPQAEAIKRAAQKQLQVARPPACPGSPGWPGRPEAYRPGPRRAPGRRIRGQLQEATGPAVRDGLG